MNLIVSALGALASLTGLVYFAGGLVLALRLAFAELPALNVVGQLPRDFLLSVGVSQVLLPALVIGAVHAIYSATLSIVEPKRRPNSWRQGRLRQRARKRFILFASLTPMALVLPGAEFALLRNDLDAVAIVVAVVAVVVGLLAFKATWHGCLKRPDKDANHSDLYENVKRPLTRRERWATMYAGLLVFGALGLAVHWFTDEGPKFLGLVAAWGVCAVVTAGYVAVRGDIARNFERRPVVAQALLSLAFAGLTIPSIVALSAAAPLSDATACTKTPTTMAMAHSQPGLLVGETTERVYVGTDGRIVSIPKSEIARVVIGVSKASVCDVPSPEA